MKPTSIRHLDAFLGTPLCLLLTALRRLAAPLRRTPARRRPHKILFIKMTEQGAVVLAAGAIRKAAHMVGAENVYFLVFGENRPVVDVLGLIPSQNVIEVRHDSVPVFIADVLAALRRIRRLQVDTVVDLEFFARASAILAFCSGASLRAGHHPFHGDGPCRGDLMTHRVAYNPHIHTAMTYAALVESLKYDPAITPLPKIPAAELEEALVPPRFEPSAQETGAVRKLLETVGGRQPSAPIIILNPNASDMLPLRRWPLARFVELGRLIIDHYPSATLVVTGQAHERAQADDLVAAIGSPRCLNLAGRTSLRELLVLFANSQLLVTNDSGPPHFASMTDIDVVVLFGPETPRLFGPLGDRIHVLTADLACSPCVNVRNYRASPCRRNVCMEAISVAAVFERLRTILAARGFPSSALS